jgi:aldose 1-epimerase
MELFESLPSGEMARHITIRNCDETIGYDTIDQYITGNEAYMGTICGRCANRIAGGRFTLEGREYRLAVNNGPNHLRGGI